MLCESDERHAGLALEGIGVADECGRVEKVAEFLAGFGAFGDSADQFFEVFDAGDVVRSVAIFQHLHVAGVIQNAAQEVSGAEFGEIFL